MHFILTVPLNLRFIIWNPASVQSKAVPGTSRIEFQLTRVSASPLTRPFDETEIMWWTIWCSNVLLNQFEYFKRTTGSEYFPSWFLRSSPNAFAKFVQKLRILSSELFGYTPTANSGCSDSNTYTISFEPLWATGNVKISWLENLSFMHCIRTFTCRTLWTARISSSQTQFRNVSHVSISSGHKSYGRSASIVLVLIWNMSQAILLQKAQPAVCYTFPDVTRSATKEFSSASCRGMHLRHRVRYHSFFQCIGWSRN